MKELIVKLLRKEVELNPREIESLIEIPPSSELGDYAFPCFVLAKKLKKAPVEIAKSLERKIKLPKELEKIEAKGPYLNFFVNKKILAEQVIEEIFKQKDNYGKTKEGKGETIVIDFSGPNIG